MSAGTEAVITPEIVTWARERKEMPLTKLAKKIHTKSSTVQSWEEGVSWPTMNQAEKLAKALHIPFGYLWLQNPPKLTVPLPDFRTVGNTRNAISPDFHDLLSDVLYKHHWYRNYKQQAGLRTLPFVGAFAMADGIKEVAESISATLGLNGSFRQHCSTFEDFLRGMFDSAESNGIIVMRSGVVSGNPHRSLSVEEFRGFTIVDPLVPLVFINGKDYKAAQIFTFVHELSHIWIGRGGISNESLGEPIATGSDIERFCNAVAATVLVPQQSFLSFWKDGRTLESNLQAISSEHCVSRIVALRRAYELGKLTWTEYQGKYKEADLQARNAEKRSKGGSAFNNLVARNSFPITAAVVQGAREGTVLYRDAAQLLNISVSTVVKVADRVEGRIASRLDRTTGVVDD